MFRSRWAPSRRYLLFGARIISAKRNVRGGFVLGCSILLLGIQFQPSTTTHCRKRNDPTTPLACKCDNLPISSHIHSFVVSLVSFRLLSGCCVAHCLLPRFLNLLYQTTSIQKSLIILFHTTAYPFANCKKIQ